MGPIAALLLSAVQPAATTAPPPPPAAAAAPVDAQRLAAARALVDAAMPPAQRDAMMTAMVQPMVDNVRRGMMDSPQLAELFGKEPRARAILDRFIAQQMEESLTSVRRSLPALMEAMTTAYARQFTLAELNDARAFYETPTGRSFIAKMPAVMADPAIAAVQTATMQEAMQRLQPRMQSLFAELAKLRAGAQ